MFCIYTDGCRYNLAKQYNLYYSRCLLLILFSRQLLPTGRWFSQGNLVSSSMISWYKVCQLLPTGRWFSQGKSGFIVNPATIWSRSQRILYNYVFAWFWIVHSLSHYDTLVKTTAGELSAQHWILKLFNTNFISKSDSIIDLTTCGEGTRHFNPLEDYRFVHHWFSGVKTPY
jgi:hypothetical protein